MFVCINLGTLIGTLPETSLLPISFTIFFMRKLMRDGDHNARQSCMLFELDTSQVLVLFCPVSLSELE
jgi:hypothetical protein